jgi:hypothetical protein
MELEGVVLTWKVEQPRKHIPWLVSSGSMHNTGIGK